MLNSVSQNILALKSQGIKALGYARVSKSQKEHERSLNNMVADLELAGCDLVLPEMVSGYQNKIRREYDRARLLIQSGEYQIFVIPRIDRIGRRFIKSVAFEEEIRSLGCHFFVLDYGRVDTSTAQGWKDFNQACLDAEFEARKTSYRVRRGKQGRKDKGQPNTGTPAYGYRNNADLSGLEFDIGGTYELARLRIETYLKLEGNIRATCEEIERLTGTPLNRRTLAKWIQLPALRGHITHDKGKVFYPHRHEPLITHAEDLQIQQLLKSRSSARGRHSHRKMHPLQGLVKCSNCEEKLYRKTNQDWHYLAHDSGSDCAAKKYSRYPDIVDQVNACISEKAAEIIKEAFRVEEQPKPKELIEKERQLEGLIRAKNETRLNTLDALIDQLSREIEAIEKSQSLYTESEQDLRDQIAALSDLDLWQTFSTEALRDIYLDVVDCVWILPGEVVRVDFRV